MVPSEFCNGGRSQQGQCYVSTRGRKEFDDTGMCIRLDTIPECDRQTDEQIRHNKLITSRFAFISMLTRDINVPPRWRRSIVVRTLVSAGELSLSCARLLADTRLLSRSLSVSQRGQLSHPSLRGGWLSWPCWLTDSEVSLR